MLAGKVKGQQHKTTTKASIKLKYYSLVATGNVEARGEGKDESQRYCSI